MNTKKIIFDGENKFESENINFYLKDTPNVFIGKRNSPLCNVPKMVFGNMPNDGNLILSAKERAELLKKYPIAENFIRPLLGAEEFINGKKILCLLTPPPTK